MDTSPLLDDVIGLPLSCTVCLTQEGVIGTGWVWGLSAHRCLIQSPLFASPGMVVQLSLSRPGTSQLRIEGLVTWARPSEFGIQFAHEVPMYRMNGRGG